MDEVTARIKKNNELKSIPIIIFTAKTDPFSKKRRKLASEDYVEKPFEALTMKKRIDTVLAKR